MTRLPFAMENIGPYTHNNARVILFCCPFWLPEKEKKKETFHSKSCCCCLAKRTTINRGTVTNRPTPARGTELNATKWNNGGGGGRTQENEDALIRHDETFAPDRQRNSINSYFLFFKYLKFQRTKILRRDIRRRRTLRIVPRILLSAHL